MAFSSQSEAEGFLYDPEIGETVEVREEHEESRKGRKRARNPEQWKHTKRPGLRKNAPHADISSLGLCCKKECIKRFSLSHLKKVREDF